MTYSSTCCCEMHIYTGHGGVLCHYLSGAQFRVRVFELVPDGLKDGGKGSDPDAGADQHADLVVEYILAGCAEGSVHTHSEERQ